MDPEWVEALNLIVEALRLDQAPPRPLARSPDQLADVRMAVLFASVRRPIEPDQSFIVTLRAQLGL